ncbi:hypothetical protein K461DRAFT_275421 [Myriangium duriaei CBS 260.36]|uniref:Uncharacterized protein n=1 Tax=Myriangium duriaei CBS 260.36 TaxID=1168546 RepID=A0A9P4J745_9PEZI|nr:hypothetical protein K461DRAFT_275421 [Myriangium duriaei CBS 260.36]
MGLSTASRLLPSALGAFPIRNRVRGWRCELPPYDPLRLIKALLDRGADPSCTMPVPSEQKRHVSGIELCLFHIQRQVWSNRHTGISQCSLDLLPLMELLIEHGASYEDQIIQFETEQRYHVVMNLTAFACFQSTTSGRWARLAQMLFARRPHMFCDFCAISETTEYHGLLIDVKLWQDDLIDVSGDRIVNVTVAPDEVISRQKEYSHVRPCIIELATFDFRGGRKYLDCKPYSVIRSPGILKALINPGRVSCCPFVPSESDVVRLETQIKELKKGIAEKAQAKIRSELERHECIHHILFFDQDIYFHNVVGEKSRFVPEINNRIVDSLGTFSQSKVECPICQDIRLERFRKWEDYIELLTTTRGYNGYLIVRRPSLRFRTAIVSSLEDDADFGK